VLIIPTTSLLPVRSCPVLTGSRERYRVSLVPTAQRHMTLMHKTDTGAALVDSKLARQMRGSSAPPAMQWSVAHTSSSYP